MRATINFYFLITGFLFGWIWSYVWVKLLKNGGFVSEYLLYPRISLTDRRLSEGTFLNRDGPSSWPEDMTSSSNIYSRFLTVDDSVAMNMSRAVKIFCMVTTTKKFHNSRDFAIKHTWGKRCNKLVFLSDDSDPSLPSFALSNSSNYLSVWGKVKKGILLAYDSGFQNFDWYLKADDDTYIVLENFRLLVSKYASNKALFLGRHLKSDVPSGFQSGGAGYAMSREALRLLYKYLSKHPQHNSKNLCNVADTDGIEDLEMGRCMFAVGAKIIDSRDLDGRQTFFPYTPGIHIKNDTRFTYWLSDFEAQFANNNLSCCGDYSISFHYISPSEMFTLDYLINRLRPFGMDRHYL